MTVKAGTYSKRRVVGWIININSAVITGSEDGGSDAIIKSVVECIAVIVNKA